MLGVVLCKSIIMEKSLPFNDFLRGVFQNLSCHVIVSGAKMSILGTDTKTNKCPGRGNRMYKNGFIMLYRKVLDWEWYRDRNTKALFFHLLLTANLQDSVWNGAAISRGARAASYAVLAGELGMTVKEVRTACGHLERTGELARRPYGRFTVFQVINYDAYQNPGRREAALLKRPRTADVVGTGQEEGQQNKKEKKTTARAGAPVSGAPDERSIYERMRD